MNPGPSPIYIDPVTGLQTNVAPKGNDPGWKLAQGPNVILPLEVKEEPKKEVPKEVAKETKSNVVAKK